MRRLGSLGRRVARSLLRGFDAEESDDVVADLEELSATRGHVRGFFYFWIELTKYPVRAWLDGLRHPDAGGVDGTRRRRRRRRSGMDGWWKDVRYALRSLARSRGFTVMAVAILAVSMGATTAITSVVKGVLLDPLPVEEPHRLYAVWMARSDGSKSRMTPGNFTDLSELDGVFEHVAAFGGRITSLGRAGESIFLRGGAVTATYFDALGVRPIVGRTFLPSDGRQGAPPVVVLSQHVWRQTFGADPRIVGESVDLDGTSFEVVGVVPAGVYPTRATVSAEIPFTASNQDFFVPLRYDTAVWSNRRSHVLGMIARVRLGVSREAAKSAVETLAGRLQATEPLNAEETFVINPFTDEVVGDIRAALLTLLGMVGLVLLIAVVNVGSLFVLRADDRQPEISIRVALGAPRARLVRQLLVESTMVATVAALGAVVLAGHLIDLMKGLVPYQIPRLADVGIDGAALLTTIGMGAPIAVAFGLAPGLRLWGGRWARVAGQIGATPGLGQRRLQGAVVALQAGLGVTVIVGAGLLVRSFAELRAVDTGFSARETWVVGLPASLETLEDIADRVRSMPGVAAAAIAYDHPLDRSWGDGFLIEGVELGPDEPAPSASLRPVGIDYFETVGIDLVSGRIPDALEVASSVEYAVVNESLRDLYFPDGTAVGARVEIPTARRMFGDSAAVFEIVGVVRDVRFLGPDQAPGPALYVPLSQFRAGARNLLVRPERAEVDVLGGIRKIVGEVAPGLAVQRAQRLEEVLDDLLARPRFNMMLLVSFGAMGLVLCGLGAYGLVSRVVAMRAGEIGIRMALGADRRSLVHSVMGTALRPIAFGGALGLALAIGVGRLIRSLLFGVSPGDPVTFATSLAFVLLVGVVATLLPTLRALAIDPAVTLRSD